MIDQNFHHCQVLQNHQHIQHYVRSLVEFRKRRKKERKKKRDRQKKGIKITRHPHQSFKLEIN